MNRWPTKTLGELCTVVAGGTPSRTRADFYKGGIPWVKISDMLQDTVTHTEETISRAGLENSAAKLLPTGTVLIPIFATIGRTAVLGIEATTNQAIAGVTPKNEREITPTFLRHFLDCSVGNLTAEARGVAQLNINGKILKSLLVPVPPLTEQERIVKLLDEADELRKLRAQADRRTDALIPSLFQEMIGENAKKPHDRVKLEQIAEVVSGVAKGRKFNGRLPVEAPYLRVANVQAGHLDLSEINTIQALPEEVKELALRKGDVLLTEGGDFDKLGRGGNAGARPAKLHSPKSCLSGARRAVEAQSGLFRQVPSDRRSSRILPRLRQEDDEPCEH
jgi:type I restriction enzyme S subunit